MKCSNCGKIIFNTRCPCPVCGIIPKSTGSSRKKSFDNDGDDDNFSSESIYNSDDSNED